MGKSAAAPADAAQGHANSFDSTLKGSHKHPLKTINHPFMVGRFSCPHQPGVALRLPPATAEQAFSLQPRPLTPSRSLGFIPQTHSIAATSTV